MRPAKPPKYKWWVTSSRNKKPKVKIQEDDRNCQENKRPKKPRSHMKSVTNTDNMQLPKPVTRRLCKDRYCQSTRCFKKATKVLKTRVLERPRCGDDKNCYSSQFLWSKKPNNAMWLKHPAVYTRKMLSDPMKRQQMQAPQKEDSSFKEMQFQRRYVDPKKINLLCSQWKAPYKIKNKPLEMCSC